MHVRRIGQRKIETPPGCQGSRPTRMLRPRQNPATIGQLELFGLVIAEVSSSGSEKRT